ncbi:MAG: hypothetical protein M3M88_03085 [Thermoproteota archaeon]|nr:hypothetical protein [Thermoproteota archaeon]
MAQLLLSYIGVIKLLILQNMDYNVEIYSGLVIEKYGPDNYNHNPKTMEKIFNVHVKPNYACIP